MKNVDQKLADVGMNRVPKRHDKSYFVSDPG